MTQTEGYAPRFTDELTGLDNMMSFMNKAGKLLKEREIGQLAFVYFDVEDFKLYNQKYGFQEGNEFLYAVAEEIKSVFRGSLVSRLNDDHFMVATGTDNLEAKINRVLSGMHNFRQNLNIEMKAGIYVPGSNLYSVAMIMDRARLACDTIKRKYDRPLCYFDESLTEKISMRNYIIANFPRALAEKYIEVYFQPEVRAVTGQICGFEALARWNDPTYGMMSPGIFIEILEDAHLIHKLDLYVVRQVCERLSEVRALGLPMTSISTNLSRLDFHLIDVFAEIDAIRQEYDIPVNLLHVEVTETALNKDAKVLHEQMDKFRAAGYEIWLDDFGSGYSSLNTLKDYYFDVLKIDMGFLRDFDKKPASKRIIASIVSLAKDLDMHTLAEGVETKEQYEFLCDIGCEKIQGYYFSKPLPFAMPGADGGWNNLFMEPEGRNAYFQGIGRINVLSDDPLEIRNRTDFVYRDQNLALVEWSGNRINFVHANESFCVFLQNVGYPNDIADITERVNAKFAPGGSGHHELVDFLLRAAASEQAETMECVLNGNICSFRALCVASDEVSMAFALMGVNLSGYDLVRQAGDFDMTVRHLLWIYNRIDLIHTDGSSQNIYVDCGQNVTAGMEHGRRWHMDLYVDNYIAPAEREAFRKFYDLSTVAERAKTARKDHITGFFHTKNVAGEYKILMYILIPFNFKGENVFMSCLRDTDGSPQLTAALELVMAKNN